MFKIEMLVEDKRLAEVLMALANRIHNLQVNPVANAVIRGGKVAQQVARPTGQLYDVIRNHILQSKADTISSSEMRDIGERMGMSPSAYSHPVSKLVGERILKKGTKRTSVRSPQIYHINRANI